MLKACMLPITFLRTDLSRDHTFNACSFIFLGKGEPMPNNIGSASIPVMDHATPAQTVSFE